MAQNDWHYEAVHFKLSCPAVDGELSRSELHVLVQRGVIC
eukprot:SAG11_NODE_35335_length_267_cov_0.613095_1_plen_39_part_01